MASNTNTSGIKAPVDSTVTENIREKSEHQSIL